MIDRISFDCDAPALWLEGREHCLTYRELGVEVHRWRTVLEELPVPAVAFAFSANSASLVSVCLACLAAKVPLGLGEPTAAAYERVITAYRPTVVLLPLAENISKFGYVRREGLDCGELALWTIESGYEVQPHPDLALMLATSGSTGDAKFVRLSRENLSANALSIAEYLKLTSSGIAVQSLPLNYSYGLSILNSHLVAGASVALTAHSFMRPEFWRVVDDCGCTSFAGVPYMYETLYRLRKLPTDHASIKTLTQAGGALKVELLHHFNNAAQAKGARMFAMYGQTEATARIAFVPPEALKTKAGCIGIAIPGGELWLEPVPDEPAVRQVCYRGRNVMLGYAQTPVDLSKGDEMGGVLYTGDLGVADGDGYLRVNGRLARFVKLFGKRVNLAHVEDETEQKFGVRCAAVAHMETMKVYVEGAAEDSVKKIRQFLAQWLGVPPVALTVMMIAKIPLTSSGKKNYKDLAGS